VLGSEGVSETTTGWVNVPACQLTVASPSLVVTDPAAESVEAVGGEVATGVGESDGGGAGAAVLELLTTAASIASLSMSIVTPP
jgi:hypothetical protein